MICDILERVSTKKIDKCLKSDLHLDSGYSPSTERLVCRLWHDTTPNYNHAFYITDMICEMALHPSRTKSLWAEMQYTLKRGNK